MVDKVVVIVSMPRAHDISWLKAFLELVNYYRKFVKIFNTIVNAFIMHGNKKWSTLGVERIARGGIMVLKERLVLASNFFKPTAKWAYKLYIKVNVSIPVEISVSE